MKKEFRLFGFTIPTKKFIITMLLAAAVYMFLLGLDLLGVQISWYGIFIGTGFILAVVISSELTKERGLYKDLPYDLIWLVFPFAIIGARIFYVMNSPHEFDGFVEMLKVWEGGLSIYGGIVGGILAVVLFTTLKHIHTVKTMDVLAPVLILGQSIGRWGNFVNQEVYGFEITTNWLKWFPFGVQVDGTWHLATFFYESVLNLIGFFVLVAILRKSKKTGIVAFTYFVWYGTVRLFLESLRVEQYILYIPGTTIQFSSLVSMLMIVTGVAGLVAIYLLNKNKEAKK